MQNIDAAGNMNRVPDDAEPAQKWQGARAVTLAEGKRLQGMFEQARISPNTKVRVMQSGIGQVDEIDGWFLGWTDLEMAEPTNTELKAYGFPALLLADSGDIIHFTCVHTLPARENEQVDILETPSYSVLGSNPLDDQARIVLLGSDDEQGRDAFELTRQYDPLESEAKILESLQLLESITAHQ